MVLQRVAGNQNITQAGKCRTEKLLITTIERWRFWGKKNWWRGEWKKSKHKDIRETEKEYINNQTERERNEDR